jgi:hypothetical protein
MHDAPSQHQAHPKNAANHLVKPFFFSKYVFSATVSVWHCSVATVKHLIHTVWLALWQRRQDNPKETLLFWKHGSSLQFNYLASLCSVGKNVWG